MVTEISQRIPETSFELVVVLTGEAKSFMRYSDKIYLLVAQLKVVNFTAQVSKALKEQLHHLYLVFTYFV